MDQFERANVKKIIFFFPYHGVGGVPVLFLRMAHALTKHFPHCQVSLIDYPDGYMSKHVTDSRIEVIPLLPRIKIHVSDGTVFVVQSLPFWRIPEELAFDSGVRFLLWHLHPLNIAPGSHWLKSERKKNVFLHEFRKMLFAAQRYKLKTFVEYCHQHHGLIFMDGANLQGVNLATGSHISDVTFVPVPGSGSGIGKTREMKPLVPLRCAWIGRLEDFKIPVLSYTIRRVADYVRKHGKPVEFHIVGDGLQASEIQALGRQLTTDRFNVKIHGEIPLEQLDEFLRDNVDVLLAMGTAALEGAKLGVPVVLLDFSYGPLDGDYQYHYLFETNEYSLGSLITDKCYEPGNSSLEVMLDQLSGTEFDKYAQLTKSYYQQHHSLESVLEKLSDAIVSTEVAYGMIRQMRLDRPDLPMRLVYKLQKFLTGKDYRISAN